MSERCGHCGKTKLTGPGLRRHIAQAPACRRALSEQVNRRLAAKVGVMDASDAAPSPSNLAPLDVDPVEQGSAVPELDSLGFDTGDAEGPNVDDAPSNPRRVTVEEVEDIEAGGLPKKPWVGEYPDSVAAVVGEGKTLFETLLETNRAAGVDNFAPFADREEWDLASWLVSSGLSQEAIDEYLTLPIVRTSSHVPQMATCH